MNYTKDSTHLIKINFNIILKINLNYTHLRDL